MWSSIRFLPPVRRDDELLSFRAPCRCIGLAFTSDGSLAFPQKVAGLLSSAGSFRPQSVLR